MEFGTRVLGLHCEDLQQSPAFNHYSSAVAAEADLIFKSRVLAYAPATWRNCISSIREFLSFCSLRGVNPLDCTPSILNLFILYQAQNGKSYGSVESALKGISFLFKFYLVEDFTLDKSVIDVMKFVAKVSPHRSNKKDAFGSVEIRAIWDKIDAVYKSTEKMPLVELRTFVMSVFQHKTFCRFSDVAGIKLSDILYDLDYFKVIIRYSKTDQGGLGQTVYLTKSSSLYRDPHMLMCLYLQKIGGDTGSDMYLFPPH